jgi:ATP-dependent Lhr-like helicase
MHGRVSPPGDTNSCSVADSDRFEFHPLVAAWFRDRYGEPTEPQRRGWPFIGNGKDVLITAPTGSGKTLAAFSICLDDLIRRSEAGALPDATLVVYVSPLKALASDVRINLDAPLHDLMSRALENEVALNAIRTAVRTGDTTPAERARMLRTPPHVLVTTPESLYILLTAARSRELFKSVTTVIVDEIHAMAGDKRGAHLTLTLARLDDMVLNARGVKPQRIGLSATVHPLEEVARFLSPSAEIVNVPVRREMELRVEVPSEELSSVASGAMWEEMYDKIAALIRAHRTTLVFVGTRRLSERVAFALTERLGEGVLLPHHGSLSREARFEAESRLKNGALRAVVATASLELGIDIGAIDLVVQIGTPRSIAVALQRIGRSGHWVGATPQGIIFAATRDELLECAALIRALHTGVMDAIAIPRAPLDILAQQLVAACAEHEWGSDELYALVRSCYPYRHLSRDDFEAVLSMLADGIATSRGRSGTWLHYDRVNKRIRPRRGARLAAITCGGAIPDTALYSVVAEPEGQVIGTLDEDFAIESMAGDIFLLGSNSWMIRRVESGVVRVEDAHGAPPSIPFWNGEGLGRTVELSREVCSVRDEIDGCDDESAKAFLRDACGLDDRGAEQAVAYVRAGKAALGALPNHRTIVAERFFDEAGGMQLVLHTPFGARVNRAWGLSLRKRFCRSFNLELQAAATDNGFLLSLSDQHAFPLEIVFEFVKSQSVEHVLTQALLPAPMFAARWRWNATRSLAILRRAGGRKVPPQILRMRSDDLLAAAFPDAAACPENLTGDIRIPDHLLVRETIDNCLHEAMDLETLLDILRDLEGGNVQTVAIDTPEPSPFSHEILNANPYAFLDDAPLEERRARAVQLRRALPDTSDGAGLLDSHAIEQVTSEVWPVVRDADELHDALSTLVVLPPIDAWNDWFSDLVAQHRASVFGRFWVCAERLDLARRAYSNEGESDVAAVTEILRGWLECIGPVTTAELSQQLHLNLNAIESALLTLENQGQILRGRFRSVDFVHAEETRAWTKSREEWCNRRVLARIHRLTIGSLRQEIEPVTAATYLRFLHRWQHVAPSSRLHGIDGTLQVVKQLAGYEVPAIAWEAHVLPARVAGYKPEYLDRLCYSGEIMWGRVSRPAALAESGASARVRPTKIAPVSLFLRESGGEIVARPPFDETRLSHRAQDVLSAISRLSAPFFGEILRETRLLAGEVEEALWELVAAGCVTADGFDALRSLIDAKRRLGEKGLRARPRSSSGRWTLFSGTRGETDPETFARRLLARWGVVCRDIAIRESLAPSWRDVLIALRRMESRGEIRGGRFVAGIGGEQFALPEAVDALRAARRIADEPVQLSSADPLQLAAAIIAPPSTYASEVFASQSERSEAMLAGSSSIGR